MSRLNARPTGVAKWVVVIDVAVVIGEDRKRNPHGLRYLIIGRQGWTVAFEPIRQGVHCLEMPPRYQVIKRAKPTNTCEIKVDFFECFSLSGVVGVGIAGVSSSAGEGHVP